MELPTTTLAIFAIVAAMGLAGVVAIQIILISEEAEAVKQEKPRGCNRSVAANASQFRCVEPGQP